jgi:hypothetical protein
MANAKALPNLQALSRLPVPAQTLPSEAVLDALKMMLSGASLNEVLTSLTLLIEAHSEGFVLPPAIAACEAIAADVYVGALGFCYAWLGECLVAECWWPGEKCCPVFCKLGHCCSEGETCMPHGCCAERRL